MQEQVGGAVLKIKKNSAILKILRQNHGFFFKFALFWFFYSTECNRIVTTLRE